MNERIKELIRQAESTANEGIGFDGQEYLDILMARFAELIVKECGEVAAFGDPSYSAQHNIHKHFGVDK